MAETRSDTPADAPIRVLAAIADGCKPRKILRGVIVCWECTCWEDGFPHGTSETNPFIPLDYHELPYAEPKRGRLGRIFHGIGRAAKAVVGFADRVGITSALVEAIKARYRNRPRRLP